MAVAALARPVAVQRGALTQLVVLCAAGFAFVLPWANLLVIPFLGTGTRAMGIALSGFWLLSVLLKDELRRVELVHRVAYCWVTWTALSIFWSPDRIFTTLVFSQFLQLFLLLIIIWNVFPNFHDLLPLKQAYVLGAWVTVLILSYNFISGQVSKWDRRATITNSNENEVGMVLAIGLPVAWYLATSVDATVRERYGRWRWLNFLYIPAGLVGIMLTASRGSFLASIPFFVYAAWSMRLQSKMRRVVSSGLLVGLVVAATFLIPDTAWERISSIPESVEGRDLGSRFGIWEQALASILASAQNLFIGTGVGTADIVAGKDAHNIVLSIVVGTGLLGLVLFGTVYGVTISRAFEMRASEREMWLTVLVIFSIASIAYSSESHKLTWLIIAMVVTEARAWRLHQKEVQPERISKADQNNKSAGIEPLMP